MWWPRAIVLWSLFGIYVTVVSVTAFISWERSESSLVEPRGALLLHPHRTGTPPPPPAQAFLFHTFHIFIHRFLPMHQEHQGLELSAAALPLRSQPWGLGQAPRNLQWQDERRRDVFSRYVCFFPFMISILGCSWLPLLPCLPSLSPFMISILGCSWLPLLPCLPSLSPLGCRCCLASPACFPSWSPFCAALGCRCRLVSPACLPSWSPFWAALGCRCCLVSPACLPLAAAAALPPQLVSLHDLHSVLLLAAAAALSPKLVSLHGLRSGLLLAAAFEFVSLHDLHSGLLLAAAAALSPSLFFPSGLLLAAAAALSPSLFSFMSPSLPEEPMVREHLRICN